MEARVASVVLVVGLLAATAAAFLVTQRLKVEPSPITGTRVDDLISPVCRCATRRAEIRFRLRGRDALTITIVDAAGKEVRTLTRERPAGPGFFRVTWDGRDGDGEVVSDGKYRARVRLQAEERTVLLPNSIEVDATKPRFTRLRIRPRSFTPGGPPGRNQTVARYRLSERASAVLDVDGRAAVRGRSRRSEGRLHWYGTIAGRRVPPGLYRLRVVVRDRAGNVARSTPVTVRVG